MHAPCTARRIITVEFHPFKILDAYALIILLLIGTLGCAAPYRHVLVSVVDSKTGQPVDGATVSIHFHPRTQTVTDHDGKAMLKLSFAEAQDPIFDVQVINKQYDQNFGYSESRNEWMNRAKDFIPAKPDIVLEVTSRIDEKHAAAGIEANQKSDEQEAEKLFHDSPDFWPKPKDGAYQFPVDNVGRILLRKRWEHASQQELGSKDDVDSISAAVIRHMKNPNAKVGDVRWISPIVVMVRSNWHASPMASAGYTYVLRKSDVGWTVIAYYLDYVS